jgi:hypothetical protein
VADSELDWVVPLADELRIVELRMMVVLAPELIVFVTVVLVAELTFLLKINGVAVRVRRTEVRVRRARLTTAFDCGVGVLT